MVSATTSRTLSASDAARALSTFKRASAPPADTLLHESAQVLTRSCYLTAAGLNLTTGLLETAGSNKAIRRKTTGTGRMAHLRDVQRRFKNQFRENTQVLTNLWWIFLRSSSRLCFFLGSQAIKVIGLAYRDYATDYLLIWLSRRAIVAFLDRPHAFPIEATVTLTAQFRTAASQASS